MTAPHRQDAAGRHRRRGEPRDRRERLVPKSRAGRVLRRPTRLSGVAGCSSARTAVPTRRPRPSSAAAADSAGNVSAPSAFGLRYDATPPAVTDLDADGGDELVRLRWAVSGATQVELWRSPGPRGRGAQRRQPRHERQRARPPRAQRTPLRLQPGRRRRRRQHRHAQLLGDAWPAAALAGQRRHRRRPADAALDRGARRPLLQRPAPPRRSQASQRVARRSRGSSSSGRGTSKATGSGSSPAAATTGSCGPGEGKRSRNDYGPLIGRGTFTVAAS